MHIAICDDNVADRKQTERLMNREADWWIHEKKPMYFASFGNATSLLATPMSYDAFFVDISCTENLSSDQIIASLRQKGVTAPIIVCPAGASSSISEEADCVMTLPKPISAGRLHEILLRVEDLLSSHASQIELRTLTSTVYLPAEDIMYAVAKDSGGDYTMVTLKSGETLQIYGSAFTLFNEIKEEHTTFVMCSPAIIINLMHVDRLKTRHVVMQDGSVFPIRHEVKKYVRLLLSWMQEHPGTTPTYRDIEEI